MENIEFIHDSFGKMSGFLTFLILVLIVFSYVALKFKEEIKSFLNNKKDNRKVKTLLFHSMFLTCDKVLKRIETMDFTTFDGYDATKTKLLKKLIQLKIETVKFRFAELLQKEEIDKMEQPHLKFLVATTLSNLVNEYNDKSLKVMTDEMQIDKENAKFLIDKYEEFREYIITAFVDELEVIVMDDNYTNNFDRMNTILYTVSISLSIIPRDVVATFNNVNGRFKKYNKAS